MVERSKLKGTKTIFCVSKIKKHIKITRSIIKINTVHKNGFCASLIRTVDMY